jgi:hypothetical protein
MKCPRLSEQAWSKEAWSLEASSLEAWSKEASLSALGHEAGSWQSAVAS